MTESRSRTADYGLDLLDTQHPEYAARRGVVDGRHRHRPALIARCRRTDDIPAALALAQQRNLPIAVRAGGHGFHGHGTVDGGLLIDLSDLREVQVEPDIRVARIQPGALSGDVLAATLPHGLAAVGGDRARVGYCGQVIFNGQGYLGPRHGNGCDNVLALRVLLADGRQLRVSQTEHPDLFWAMRGAGDAFGIVIGLEVGLHPVPDTVHVGELQWSPGHERAALLRLAELDGQLSDGVQWSVRSGSEQDRGPAVILEYSHVGPDDAHRSDLDHLRSAGPVVAEDISVMSYHAIHHRPGFTGARSYVAGAQLARLDGPTADVLLGAVAPATGGGAGHEHRAVHVYPLRGALGRVPAVPNAYTVRSGLVLSARVSYDNPKEDVGHASWAESVVESFVGAGLTLYGANGTSVNHVSRIDSDVVTRVYGSELPRLTELKRRYDPANVFARSTIGLLTG